MTTSECLAAGSFRSRVNHLLGFRPRGAYSNI